MEKNKQTPIKAEIKDGKIFFEHLKDGFSVDGFYQIADHGPLEIAACVDDVIISISRMTCHIFNNLSDEDIIAMRGHLPNAESMQFLGILSEALKKIE